MHIVSLTELDPARGCGSVEEGTITAVRCAVPITTDFTTFGTQVMSPSGSSRDLSVCYRNGTCVDREPNNYQAEMAVGISNSTAESLYVLVMKVGSVSREDPVVQCVIDGIVSAQCTLDVYGMLVNCCHSCYFVNAFVIVVCLLLLPPTSSSYFSSSPFVLSFVFPPSSSSSSSFSSSSFS